MQIKFIEGPTNWISSWYKLSRLERVQEDSEVLRLLTKVTNNDTVAGDNLLGNSVLVDLAETNPLTELVTIGNLQELDLVFSAQGLDKTDVFLLFAGLGEDTQVGLTAIQGLDGLTETTGKTVVDHGTTEDLDEGGFSGDLSDNGDSLFNGNNDISFS